MGSELVLRGCVGAGRSGTMSDAPLELAPVVHTSTLCSWHSPSRAAESALVCLFSREKRRCDVFPNASFCPSFWRVTAHTLSLGHPRQPQIPCDFEGFMDALKRLRKMEDLIVVRLNRVCVPQQTHHMSLIAAHAHARADTWLCPLQLSGETRYCAARSSQSGHMFVHSRLAPKPPSLCSSLLYLLALVLMQCRDARS